MATKEEVRQRVGEELGLVPIGQELEAQDQNRIDATYAEVYALLQDKELASWAFTSEVPDKLVPYLSLLMEEKLANGYSIPDTRLVRIKNSAGENGATALAMIASLSVPTYESTDTNQDF